MWNINLSIQKLDFHLPTPRSSYSHDAGVDLYARQEAVLEPGERKLLGTGIAVGIPPGYAGLVVPRSGLAARYGVGVVNSPGLIDAGYRGEVKVILINHGPESFQVNRGDRIAQLVVVPVAQVTVIEVESLDETERGEGGLGSSGR